MVILKASGASSAEVHDSCICRLLNSLFIRLQVYVVVQNFLLFECFQTSLIIFYYSNESEKKENQKKSEPQHAQLLYIFFIFFSVLWNPSGNGSQVITVCEQHLELWDLDRSTSTAEVCCHETLYCPLYSSDASVTYIHSFWLSSKYSTVCYTVLMHQSLTYTLSG